MDRRLMGSYGYADGWQYFMSTVSDVLKQVRACEVGIRMSTVLESGGWRRTLKGVLWWLVVVLLVGGTLANQVSESRGTAAPLSGKKGDGTCWRLAWRWWCLSWGSGQVPVTASVDNLSDNTFECEIVHCYVHKSVDLGFDALGLFFENPIKLWTLGMKYLIAKLPTLWKFVGLFITFLFLNILAFIYLRVADVIIKLWKVCKWVCGLPLISVVTGFFTCMYSFFVSIPGKVEKQEKKERERKEKQANAILGPSSRLLKEIGKRLAEAEKVLDNQEDMRREEKQEETAPCPCCGKKGHDESLC